MLHKVINEVITAPTLVWIEKPVIFTPHEDNNTYAGRRHATIRQEPYLYVGTYTLEVVAQQGYKYSHKFIDRHGTVLWCHTNLISLNEYMQQWK